MSKQFHSPEPWDYSRKFIFDNEACIVADCADRQDAARIVACVNACEGIEDPEDFIKTAEKAVHEAAKILSQRDELLAALKVCAASLATYGSHPIIEKQVNNAIAKVKGGGNE
jgi:tagatose-1,6-bisphosphate aldolase